MSAERLREPVALQALAVGEHVFPLAPFAGGPPPAPDWFARALTDRPVEGRVEALGVQLETLAWGNPDAPGVLLMHGQSAHAGWWRHVAPFLSRRNHVVAFSWSGMGRSGWRERYSTAAMQDEALAVMEAHGFFARSARPIIVGHSLGGLPTIGLGARVGDALGGAVVVDTSVSSRRILAEPSATHSSRIYPTVEAALARFRFVSSLGRELPYVADLVAREGLAPVRGENGAGGWRWCFDPGARSNFEKGPVDIGAVRCPLTLIYGEESIVVHPDARAAAIEAAPEGTCVVVIPGSGHHVMAEQPVALIAALQAVVGAAPQLPARD